MTKRLTDEELESLEYHGCSSGTGTAPMVRDAIVKATTELRAYRAALTPERVDHVSRLAEFMQARDKSYHLSQWERRALVALDALIALTKGES